MIAKENPRELYLERSLHALLNKAFEEKLQDLHVQNTEKHTQSNSNKQKSFLFKAELNEVLKKREMQKQPVKLDDQV